MDLINFQSLILSLLIIAIGFFIKNTTHKNFQSAKRMWKALVIIGIAGVIFQFILVLM